MRNFSKFSINITSRKRTVTPMHRHAIIARRCSQHSATSKAERKTYDAAIDAVRAIISALSPASFPVSSARSWIVNPRSRRRRIIADKAREYALFAPLATRETPTCEQCAACSATDARVSFEGPHSVIPPTAPFPHLRKPSLSRSQYQRKREKGRERPSRRSWDGIWVRAFLSFSFSPLSLCASFPFSLLLYLPPFLSIYLSCSVKATGPNIWLRHTCKAGGAANFDFRWARRVMSFFARNATLAVIASCFEFVSRCDPFGAWHICSKCRKEEIIGNVKN